MLVPYQLPSQNPTCFCCQIVSMIRNTKVLEDQIGQFQGRKRQIEMGVNLSFECSIDRCALHFWMSDRLLSLLLQSSIRKVIQLVVKFTPSLQA